VREEWFPLGHQDGAVADLRASSPVAAATDAAARMWIDKPPVQFEV
jgi:hypothetical protein